MFLKLCVCLRYFSASLLKLRTVFQTKLVVLNTVQVVAGDLRLDGENRFCQMTSPEEPLRENNIEIIKGNLCLEHGNESGKSSLQFLQFTWCLLKRNLKFVTQCGQDPEEIEGHVLPILKMTAYVPLDWAVATGDATYQTMACRKAVLFQITAQRVHFKQTQQSRG